MAVFLRGETWWYEFWFAERRIRESAKTHLKTLAKEAEKKRRRELEEGYNNLKDNRSDRVQSLAAVADAYLTEYELKHRSAVYARHALRHVKQHLGEKMLVDITDSTVGDYQIARLREEAAPKTINEEVGFLLRLLGEQGDAIRGRLRRARTLKLAARETVGKAYTEDQKKALLDAAKAVHLDRMLPSGAKRSRTEPGTRSPFIRPALALALSAGMRDAEIRNTTWRQVDFEKRLVTVGKSKTAAGEGRPIPINGDLFEALAEHARWYTARFGTINPDWYLFPARGGKPQNGKKRPYDPTKPVSTLKTAWQNVKELAGVTGRFHDTRHTLITELAENGAGDQTIMDIVGHVSRRMLARYSHIRTEAKRRALESISVKKSSSTQARLESASDVVKTGTVQ